MEHPSSTPGEVIKVILERNDRSWEGGAPQGTRHSIRDCPTVVAMRAAQICPSGVYVGYNEGLKKNKKRATSQRCGRQSRVVSGVGKSRWNRHMLRGHRRVARGPAFHGLSFVGRIVSRMGLFLWNLGIYQQESVPLLKGNGWQNSL